MLMIREWLVKKLITPEILTSIMRMYPDVVNDYMDSNIDYLFHMYMSRQHVNCRCVVPELKNIED